MSREPNPPEPTSPGEARVAWLLRGRVQGVGFRWWTRATAQELGVRGTVCNRGDGSVEVHAAAESRALEAFERRLRTGPSGARVDALEEIASADPLPADFRIVY